MTNNLFKPLRNWLSILMLVIVGILSVLLLLYWDRSWRNSFRKQVVLLDNIMHARITLNLGCSWLDKMLDGDESIKPAMIRGLFERAVEVVSASENSLSKIVELPGFRESNKDLLTELAAYKISIRRTCDLALERWEERGTEEVEGRLRAQFSSAINEADLSADVIDLMVNQHISRTLSTQKKIQGLTLALWVVFLAGMSLAVFIIEGKRERAEKKVRDLSRRLISAQETERQRVAHDLHDNLAQELALLKIHLDHFSSSNGKMDSVDRRNINDLSKRMEKAVRTVRELAYGLHPAGIEQLGLVKASSQHCQEFSEETGLKVDFMSAGMTGLRLDPDVEITVYRLLQEGLNNAAKHAEASGVKVRLTASFPQIILRIEDDGKGFDRDREANETGNLKKMGIRCMEERVALLQGTMKIRSKSGKGTSIVAEIPYREKKNGTETCVDCG